MENHSRLKGKIKIAFLIIILFLGASLLFCGFLLGKKSDSSGVFPCSDMTACNEEESHAEHGANEGTHAEDAHTEDMHTEDMHSEDTHSESEHAAEGIITLADSTIKQFGIEFAQAGAGKIGMHTILPAEIALNNDKKAHVVPRVPGVVRSVEKTLGDKVRAGEVLAVIHSRELADFKAAYLAAREKITLVETLFDREKNLWEEKITAEQEYLRAKRDVADARIELRSAEQKLHALGFSEDYLETLPNAPEESYIVYEITAPIDGTIVEKHITMGEMLRDDSEPFVIADLDDVWVNVNIHQKDLPRIKQGQKAILKTEHNRGEGIVSYVSSVVDENTRTALARIILPNDSGQWRPGTFATAEISVEEFVSKVVVPKDSIISLEGKSLVFVQAAQGYQAQQVQPGRMNSEYVEIVSGLEPGQTYVAKGAFTLKSEMTKSTGDPCGGH